MYEPHEHPDLHGPQPQQDTTVFWRRSDQVQQHTPGEQPGWAHEVNGGWDPVEELAGLLQESSAPGPFGRTPYGDAVGSAGSMDHVTGLKHAATAEGQRRQASGGHRRGVQRSLAATLLRTGSTCTAVLVAVIATLVSILSGLAICDTLRHSAGLHTARGVVGWWPLLVYGPWVVASLSILRSALHQRRALHSWSMVLLFSTLATLLCVAQAPRTLTAGMSSALPAVATLACFQQLVRQITLTRPPRQAAPRHRNPQNHTLRPGHTSADWAGPAGPAGGGRPGYSGADKSGRPSPSGRGLGYGA
ncbi:hypothetical protein [Streptomyces yangpuensis]|uniref:DUF2637 domain-containing protein n=1 Tax=Streptomyces yangpuensis TaxID=1648182 RepID=A0ABY5QAK8_9ACTN|nr:hypothetical protein [Streptomyces yangpuensis]UUY52653.1 hypothetical protein NRK68_35985 [Streptomyces yangpuensis]